MQSLNNLRDFMIHNYFDKNLKFTHFNNLEWQSQYEILYKQIHHDILQADFRINILDNKGKTLLKQKILFDVLPEILQKYYQLNLIYIFKPIFMSFILQSSVSNAHNFFLIQEDEFKPFHGDPQQFYQGFDVLLNVSIQFLNQIIKKNLLNYENHFDEDLQNQISKQNSKIGEIFVENKIQSFQSDECCFFISKCQNIDVQCFLLKTFILSNYKHRVLFTTLIIISTIFSCQNTLIAKNQPSLFMVSLNTEITSYNQITSNFILNSIQAIYANTSNIKILEQLYENTIIIIKNKDNVKAAGISTGVLGLVGGVAGIILGIALGK